MKIYTQQYVRPQFRPLRSDLLIDSAPLSPKLLAFWNVDRAINCSPNDTPSDPKLALTFLQMDTRPRNWASNISQIIDFIDHGEGACIVFSAHGKSRAQFVLLLYLMARLKVRLALAMQFFSTYNVIRIKPFFLTLLQEAEQSYLQHEALSSRWIVSKLGEEQQLMVNTMLNVRKTREGEWQKRERDGRKEILEMEVQMKGGRGCDCKVYKALIPVQKDS